jgi:UDP-MurNAc hydroxylase
MNSKFSIEFVNHASFILKKDNVQMMCDPWLFGSAFNFGWDLLIESKFDFNRFQDINYIWFSHEHPDHFSPIVLKKINEEHRKNITILYQETEDKKVVNFCKTLGFKTLELPDYQTITLTEGFDIMCAKVPFFDSWIFCTIDGVKVLNSNDCVVDGDAKVEMIKKYTGEVDVLFTQFSYAGWKGNKEDTHLRRKVAKQKLEIVENQIKVLKPKYTIPFASFVYFSHEENKFMNDAVNLPQETCDLIKEAGSEPVLLFLEDSWTYDDQWNNQERIDKYNAEFENVPNKKFNKAAKSFTENELSLNSQSYINRLKEKNNFTLVRLAKLVPFLNFFKPVRIFLYDINKIGIFSITKGMTFEDNNKDFDVKMHTESLDFIFKFDWGYETLTVNGRFEAQFEGLSKMTKIFSIGPMNNMGKYISWKWLLSNTKLIFEFFSIISRTKKMLATTENSN